MDSDDSDRVGQEQITLVDAFLGYDIYVKDERAGAIEGVPGRLEYITVEMHWEGKGVARAAVREFIALSRAHGCSEVSTNNATHPAMEHILETEGFTPHGEVDWVKQM